MIYFSVTDYTAIVNLKSPLWYNSVILIITSNQARAQAHIGTRHQQGINSPLLEGLEVAGESAAVQISSVSPSCDAYTLTSHSLHMEHRGKCSQL